MNSHPFKQYGLAEGERQKDKALDLLSCRREAYVQLGRRALLERLLESEAATADDVRQSVKFPEGISPKCFGAVPGPLEKMGIIVPDGFQKTARPAGHARPVTVWRLRDRAAAVEWLKNHPDLSPEGNE